MLVLVSRVAGQPCGKAPLSDITHSIETADAAEARVTALCHVVCTNYVLQPGVNSTNGTNSTNSNTTSAEGEATILVSSLSYIRTA